MQIKNCSKIGLGTWNFSGIQQSGNKKLGWPDKSIEEKHKILLTALSLGINFLDTSDFYGLGEVESVIGNELNNQDIFIATKGGLIDSYNLSTKKIERNFSEEYIVNAIEHSRKRLNRTCIDLYQLHGPDVESLRNASLWYTLEKAKSEGFVSMLGVSLRKSSINDEVLKIIIDNPLIESVQIPSNLINIQAFHFGYKLRNAGKIVIGRSPFLHGLFLRDNLNKFNLQDPRADFIDDLLIKKLERINKVIERFKIQYQSTAQFILNYILSSNCFDIVLTGASNTDQLSENLKFNLFEKLSDSQISEIKSALT